MTNHESHHDQGVPADQISPGPVVSMLTPEQVERVTRYKGMLVEHDPTPLVATLLDFSRDRHPEREIRLWELIADVYHAELADRSLADATERHLLYRALLACSFSTDPADVLSSVPEAEDLPELERVILRFTAAQHHVWRQARRPFS